MGTVTNVLPQDPLRTILKESGLKTTATTRIRYMSPSQSRPTILELTLGRLARWMSTFIAAWFSLQLLHSGQTAPNPEVFTDSQHEKSALPPKKGGPSLLAGRTLDLTLFSVTRAVDVLIGEWWSRRSARRQASGRWTKVRAGPDPFLSSTTLTTLPAREPHVASD